MNNRNILMIIQDYYKYREFMYITNYIYEIYLYYFIILLDKFVKNVYYN